MCNCGNKRSQFAAQPSFKPNEKASAHFLQNKMWPDVSFEYIGKTALTVQGKISGKTYRFNKPGDIQQVGYRDAPSLMNLAFLRKLSK
jgi:hypothetical protein